MTCIRTGAVLFIENYGFTVPADVYQIDPGFYIFRWVPEGKDFLNERKPTHRIDYIVNSGEWFHRDDLGITVVPAKHVCVFNE